MNKMLWLVIGIAAIFGVLAAALGSKRGGARRFTYKTQPIMTPNEQEFFLRLVHANPDGYVFPQVALSALLAPTVVGQKNRLIAFRQISQKRVDYAIYDKDLSLLCVVELDDRTHNASKDAQRDQLLSSAGIRTVRWQSKQKPDEATIKRQLDELQAPEINNANRSANAAVSADRRTPRTPMAS